MFKRVATDLDTQSTTTQQKLTCALKNARLLPGGCCGINDNGNEIVFGINISPSLTMIAGLDGADQWLGLPGHRTSHQWTISCGPTLKPWFTYRQLILQMILLPVLLRPQQPSRNNLAFWAHTSVSAASLSAVYRGRWPHIWTSALNCYEIQIFFFSEYFSGFAWFPNFVPIWWYVSAARSHLQHTVPWQ